MTKKVSIYGKNSAQSPSQYYSVMQYTNKLDNILKKDRSLWSSTIFRISMKPFFRKGFGSIIRKTVLLIDSYATLIFLLIADAFFYQPDIVIICKVVFPRYMPGIFKSLYLKLIKNREIIWVFDDNIKNSGEISNREWDMLCEYASKIMVTHDNLKQTLPIEAQQRVSFIPQADGDITKEIVSQYQALRESTYQSEIYLVWVATNANMPFLLHVIDSLDMAAEILKRDYHKQLFLKVVCNLPLNYQTNHLTIENITWTRDGAAREMAKSHIGIMPLIDTEFTRGKGGFKLVQYMTAELPSIASNVGWNKSVIGDSAGILVNDKNETIGWIKAIVSLATNWQLWTSISKSAKIRCAEKFSFENNLQTWKRILVVEKE